MLMGNLPMKMQQLKSADQSNKKLIIKPSIESGQGRLIEVFSVENDKTSLNGQSTKALFNKYKKDYIIQEFLEQSEALKRLNDSTLNTMRIMSYLRSDGVHVLSTVLRIGKSGAHTDNYTLGGIICGVQENGQLKPYGFTNDGKRHAETLSGVSFDGFQIPNYRTVINFVKKMHPIVPYFKIISWDIALDASESPVLIEYNTYYQATELHQVTNGPLFGEFKDEILAAGLD